jgi:hypothetical protein
MYDNGVGAACAMNDNNLYDRGKDYVIACHEHFFREAMAKAVKTFKITTDAPIKFDV